MENASLHPDLLPLEAAALQMLLNGVNPELHVFRQQLSDPSTTLQRTTTGVGFYVDFEVDDALALRHFPRIVIGDVFGDISGLEHDAGFLLFIDNGKISMLEGHCFDESWKIDTGRKTDNDHQSVSSEKPSFHLYYAYTKDNNGVHRSSERDPHYIQSLIHQAATPSSSNISPL